jgi:hypothetical protein
MQEVSPEVRKVVAADAAEQAGAEEEEDENKADGTPAKAEEDFANQSSVEPTGEDADDAEEDPEEEPSDLEAATPSEV